MILSIIAAMDENRLIGADNQLPWHLPADLRRFKAVTMGKPIVMGRKTFDSIGRPLPGRKNIVISRNQQLSLDGCITVQSVAQAMQAAGAADEVMIMGGASFYQLLLPYVHRLYLTHVEHCFSGDAWFPVVDYTAWEIAHEERHEPDAKNDYAYRFVDYIRKDQPPVWVD